MSLVWDGTIDHRPWGLKLQGWLHQEYQCGWGQYVRYVGQELEQEASVYKIQATSLSTAISRIRYGCLVECQCCSVGALRGPCS